MKILGISCYYHDAAAALLIDGQVVAAAEEERFTRRKHDSRFPVNAANYCLEAAGVRVDDVDAVAFYDKELLKLERALSVASEYPDGSEGIVDRHVRHYVNQGADLPGTLKASIGYEGPVYYSEHHLSHAAAAYDGSGFENAAILTVDGVGEWATTGLYHGHGNTIEQLKEIRYPQSLGMFYATLTAFLGFEVNEGEYKVMGLASYGDPAPYRDQVKNLVEMSDDGSFRLNLDYFAYMYDEQAMFSPAMVDLLGEPRVPGAAVTERHMNIAAAMQELTEEAVINLARAAQAETGAPNLCLCGGVAHNVVANTKIAQAGIFQDIFVQPASGDSGSAIGAAYMVHRQLTGERPGPASSGKVYDTCLGPSYGNDEIRVELERRGLDYEELEEDELCAESAKLLSEDFVLGWFQGRMEFGPRALGCRSILGNPANPDMKDILNARVKFREEFRPFAPAVVEERASEFFEWDRPSRYMLFTPDVRDEFRDRLPSITHADGTARVQTVTPELNPRFHKLITRLGEHTEIPVVINTSFNIKGEPIVCTPADAVNCFLGTDIDYLVIGNFIASKPF